MIVNRINYVGGFIDSKAILNAFNVTRKYKQASWFSEAFAISLIKQYITTNNIIDPFAGWGTRLKAALKLHKSYLGIDANETLVNQINNSSYTFGNANTFTYSDKSSSVFTCPPYGFTEKYFDTQENKTTDEWIDIVLSNIKVKEYLFVVKKTEKYKDFIIDYKVNKSHFGVNKESIVYIKGCYD